MARGPKDRHWKIATVDLCASGAESLRILTTLRAVARETSPENHGQPGRKESLRLDFSPVWLTA